LSLEAVEGALAGLPDEALRLQLGGPGLVGSFVHALELDEDDVARATRRGLLLAAASGDPSNGIAPGSRAVLETASELTDPLVEARLAIALDQLSRDVRHEAPVTAATAAALAGDRAASLEALAAVLLQQALEN
jgi:hypothetical protein